MILTVYCELLSVCWFVWRMCFEFEFKTEIPLKRHSIAFARTQILSNNGAHTNNAPCHTCNRLPHGLMFLISVRVFGAYFFVCLIDSFGCTDKRNSSSTIAYCVAGIAIFLLADANKRLNYTVFFLLQQKVALAFFFFACFSFKLFTVCLTDDVYWTWALYAMGKHI